MKEDNLPYGYFRECGVQVSNPLRTAMLVPASVEKYVPMTPEQVRVYRRYRIRKILRKILLVFLVVVVGVGVSGVGGWLLGMIPGCSGLNILWGIGCGLVMVVFVTGIIDD